MAITDNKVRDVDNGYRSLVRKMKALGLNRAKIDVGIFAEEGAKEHPTPPGRTFHEAIRLIDVAIVNEFGSNDGHIPSRSYIRAWYDLHYPEMVEDVRAAMVEYASNARATPRDFEKSLQRIAQKWVGQIQERISDRIDPANRPRTIQLKGSDVPLIDGGVLRSSITYRTDIDGRKVKGPVHE